MNYDDFDTLLSELKGPKAQSGAMSYEDGGEVASSNDQLMSDQDVGLMSDDEVGLGGAPRGGDQLMSDQDVGLMSDDEVGLGGQRPEAEGPLKAAGREAAHAALPTIGALPAIGAGAEAGAAIGAAGGPIGAATGAIVGGAVGALGAGYALSKGQEWVLNLMGFDDNAQRAINQEEHPYATLAGSLAPAAVAFSPGSLADSMASRAAAGGILGGLEAGEELAHEGHVEPGKVAMATGFGAVFNRPTSRVGRPLLDIGKDAGTAAVARAQRPGRPDGNAVEPTADEADAAEQSQVPIAAANSSLAQPPVNENVAGVGNPDSAPVRSERVYGKDKQPDAAVQPPTNGDIKPDVQSALDATLGQNGTSPEAVAEMPTPESRNLLSEPVPGGGQQTPPPEPPIQTGLVEAAAEQARPRFRDRVVDASKEQAGVPEIPPEQQGEPRVTGAVTARIGPNARKPTPGLKPREEPAPVDTEHAAVEEAAKDVNTNPTEGQKEAGNYAKGHTKAAGLDLSMENPRGSMRRGAGPEGPWEVELPDHYGYLKRTKGADGDQVDAYVGSGGPREGDQHFIVDQHDAETGKFDEHKLMLNYRDADAAREAYLKAFSDGKGEDRLGAITPVSKDELHDWIDNGDTTKPFAKDNTPVRTPKVVTEALKQLRATEGGEKAAAAIEKASPEDAPKLARRALEALTNRSGRVRSEDYATARIPSKPPEVETLGVTARSKADAERKGTAVKAWNSAFDAFSPSSDKIPTSKEDIAALRTRLQGAVDHAQSLLGQDPFKAYRPNEKPASYMWLRAAQKLLQGKRMTPKQIADFVATEKQLRSGAAEDVENVRNTNRIEADIGRSRRSGEDAIANAENAKAREFPGELSAAEENPEHTTTVKSDEDLPQHSGEIDMTTPEGQQEVAKALGSPIPKWKAEREAKYLETAAQIKALKKAREDAQSDKPSEPVPVRKVMPTADLNTKYNDMLKLAEAKGKSRGADLDITSPEELQTSTARDLYEKFINDEKGGGNPSKLVDKLREGFKPEEVTTYRARKPKTPEEEYAYNLDEDLHRLNTQEVDHKQGLIQQAAQLPIKDTDLERMYLAYERGDIGKLEPELQTQFNKYLKPVLDQNEVLFDNIKAIHPELLGPEVNNHMMRIVKGGENDLFAAEDDPVQNRAGGNAIKSRAKGPMLARKFVALERQDGKRFVVSLRDDGFTLWQGKKPIRIKDPIDFEAGKQIKFGSNTYTMRDATTPEIEANTPVTYYHNAALSAYTTNAYLGSIGRHLQFLEDLKKRPEFMMGDKQLASDNVAWARDHRPDWIETKLPNFKGWLMDPRLAHVMDDYNKPGLSDDALDRLRSLSQAVTKTIFWMPTAHIANVGAHWFAERGWQWINPAGYRNLVVDGAKAIRSVIAQDEIQSQIRQHGGSTMYGNVLTSDFMTKLGNSLGLDIKRNPAKWDILAKKIGVGPSTLLGGIYRASSKAMWAANDMFYTQAVLDRMDRGYSMEQAIKHVEKHIPNYRIGAEIMGSRTISKVLQDPLLFSFSRYHAGVFNSYANMIHDMVKGNAHAKVEAAGQLLAVGLLAYGLYPLLDKAAKKLTGNEHAEMARRGPLTLLHTAENMREGKADLSQAVRESMTFSPMLATGMEAFLNRDYGGKPIVQPGDVVNAGHGSAAAGARVVAQEAEHAARGLYSPYGTFANASKAGRGALQTIRDQALDIKEPSPKAVAWQGQQRKRSQQEAISRFKNPPGPAERLLNKYVGFK